MRLLVSLLIGIGLVIRIDAQSFDHGLLERYFTSQPGLLPVEGAELEADPSGTRGMVFRSKDTIWDTLYLHGNGNGYGGGRKGEVVAIIKDSIFLYTTGTVCLLCLGCPCVLSNLQRLAAIPVDSVYTGLPLQKIARVWGTIRAPSSSRYMYFMIARRNSFLLYTYRFDSYSANPPILQRVDTVAINSSPPLGGRYVLGIDTFYQSGTSQAFHIRFFGQRGWIGTADYVSGNPSTVPVPGIGLLSDSLDICASGAGYFGTLKGQILDPALGFSNPVQAANNPISVINGNGAVGDSGQFVLHEMGRWRPFRLGSGSLRNFTFQFRGPSTEGFWGMHGNFWDNRFQQSSHFIKDDSTVWAYSPTNLTALPGRDSLVTFASNPGSAQLQLLDPDSNYSRPSISLRRGAGTQKNLDSIWGNFSRGCGGAPMDSITCFWPNPLPRISLDWDVNGVRIRSQLRKARWRFGMTGYMVYGYMFENRVLALDTFISWNPGDTLRVQFSNASYNLFNASPVAIPSSRNPKTSFQIRVIGGDIQWSAANSNSLYWSLRELNGRPVMRGQAEPGSGKIRIPAHIRGVRIITFTDVSTGRILWKSRLFIP